MMRKFTFYLVLCATTFFVSSCNDDVSDPPKSGLAVDQREGIVTNDDKTTTEFTFTVDQVGANTISVLPYGTAMQSLGGIPVAASSFVGGKATVKFKYSQVGTFKAVVASNNHKADGTSSTVYSNEIEIVIKSPDSQMKSFSFAKIEKDGKVTQFASKDTKIDQAAHTIKVLAPYGQSLTGLVATFEADHFTTVAVGGGAQESGKTSQSFASDVVYKVTASNGTSTDYTVTVTNDAINTDATFKSFTGKETSKYATATLGSSVADNGDLILYDVYGTQSTNFDSVNVKYELNNGYAAAHLGTEANKFKQDTRLDLTANKTIKIMAQDSLTVTHNQTIRALEAPLLTVGPASGTNIQSVNTGFTILAKALKGEVTDSQVDIAFYVTEPDNVDVTGISFKDIAHPAGFALSNGDDLVVDFSDAVTVTLTVTDNTTKGGGVTYTVVYNVGLTELK